MKRFFYKHTTLIFGLNGLIFTFIQYLLASNTQTKAAETGLIIFSGSIQIGGGIFLGYLIQRLYILTNMDYLTGISNRKKFQEYLDTQAQLNTKANGELSLLMIDLDKFKSINDTFGHPVGDKVLIHIATLLREEVRNNDLVARVGGEEFAIVLPNTKRHEATMIAERIKARVQNEIFPYDGKEVSISVGVASIKGHESICQLYQSADDALYLAKDKRNTVVTMS